MKVECHEMKDIDQECCDISKTPFDPEIQKCTPCDVIPINKECCQENLFGDPIAYDPGREKCSPCGPIPIDK